MSENIRENTGIRDSAGVTICDKDGKVVNEIKSQVQVKKPDDPSIPHKEEAK